MAKKWKKKLKKQKAMFMQGTMEKENKDTGKNISQESKYENIGTVQKPAATHTKSESRFNRVVEKNEIVNVISDLDEETKLVKTDVRRIAILTGTIIVFLAAAVFLDQKYGWIIKAADILFNKFSL
jgi:hypothetical protein